MVASLRNRSTRNAHELARVLNHLTAQTSTETAAMSQTSAEMRKDSQSMTILAAAALFYMPASLVAVSYNFRPFPTRVEKSD